MDEKKLNIICPNQLVTFFNPMALLVYCLSQTAHGYGINRVSVKSIAYKMKCGAPLQTNKKNEIINALDDLCDLGFMFKDKYWGYMVNTRTFYNQAGGFEKCPIDDFNMLRDNAPLFQHYMLIRMGMIDGKCTYDINYFTKMEGVSDRTITRRNQELVDKELIYIYRPLINESKKEYGKNTYVLYNDQVAKKTEKSTGNINRSVSLRYNSFVKHPEKFTPLQRKELRKQVEEYNVRNPGRIKDLSVFST